MSLTILHEGCQELNLMSGIILGDEVHDLLLGVFHHRLARLP